MLLHKACFCLLVIFTWNSTSGHQRTTLLDWPENTSMLPKRKKIFSSCSKISKYSAPLRRSSVSYQLIAQGSFKFCYIVSQPQDFFSTGRQIWPLGYLLNRPDVRGKLGIDLAVAFEHLQHQISVGCAAQPQAERLGHGCAGPGTETPGGLILASRQEAAAWGKRGPERCPE